jgi:hypothetical protein
VKVRFFELKYRKNIQKIMMPPSQVICMLNTDKLYIGIWYYEYEKDENWTERIFKIVGEDDEYNDIHSHQFIGAFEKDSKRYMLFEKLIYEGIE